MFHFRRMRSLKKIAAVHSSIDNLFNADRALNSRDIFKANHTNAFTEWRQICVLARGMFG